ncbi:TonB-dependent receptor domain-containing protein [Glaciecola siphonariae]|uniref:TonB-dependent receptor domain-containing protein n=1 Tax=Glaciecola siphonariae TaxID=521012 RepID=A0ABV9LZQ4_9ALTE
MRKLSKVAALVCATLSAGVYAKSLEGIVLGADGKPVADANVEIHGLGLDARTDASGRFVFPQLAQGDTEVHIRASGFAHLHRDLSVPSEGLSNVTFTLKRSAIEVIDIVSTPLHMSSMESSIPISVLSGETLRRQQSATLGDSLEKIAGVHTNFHAKVASTPVIRGLSGPRVLIAQNGMDVSDVSRVGPDHAVASEASTATQIEVLRGPATLFYGSGAIGGVVNVVDNRVPTDNETRGEFLLEGSTVDEQKLASFNVTTGFDNFAFYADGFYRDSDDYEVPVMPELEAADHNHEHEHEHEHEHGHNDEHDNSGDFFVENSAEESYGFTLGGSYLLDNGFIGVSVEQFNREYGIPGHSHGDESHGGHSHDGDHSHDDNHEDEHGDEHSNEHSEEVFADLEQTRAQLLGEFNFDHALVREVNLRAGYTDYEHSEIEHGTVGTVFANETYELRIDTLHQPFYGWRGGVSLHYKNTDIEAQGSEAFTPPSSTEMFGIALIEERHFGDVLVQLGARIERVTMDASDVQLPMLDAHSHDDEHGDDEHDHDHDHEHDHGSELEITRVFTADHEFTPITLSAGAVWDFAPGYNLALSVSRSERAPSASELLSFGPHIGTRTYEVGALFALTHDEHGHDEHNHDHDHEEGPAIGLTDEVIDLETANNIDLTFRKTEGDVGFIFNAFYNSVDNYYYQVNTGLFADDGHDHGSHDHGGHDSHDHGSHDHGSHEHGDAHEHEGELPVFIFRTDDVILHGFEAQVAWQVTNTFKASVFADYVRARLKDGDAGSRDLPRTPPLRFGSQFSYQNESLSAHLDITRYQSQDKIANFETETDGYTLVDAGIAYDLPILDNNVTVYLKGNNLTDTEARVHTSFLKDIAPRPGRNLSIGVRGYF